MRTVALGIPHLPDNGGARDRSLGDLRAALAPLPDRVTLKVFDEKEPNRAWARKLWTWGAESGADFFLTLQDDVRVCPNFWGVLAAMLTALPPRALLGLSAQDARIGVGMRPWVRSRAWVVGWAYGMWVKDCKDLAAHDLSGATPAQTEDAFVGDWAKATERDVWHPVPTPAQHRCEIPSTYSNWPKPATCDWTALPDDGRMLSPAFWKVPLDAPPPHLQGMVQTQGGGPALHHPNIMGSPNWGGSPPVPWNR